MVSTKTLSAEPRETIGKYGAFNLRKEGRLPVEIYGHGEENIHLHLEQKAFVNEFKAGVRLFNLEVGGTTHRTVLRQLQYGVFKNEILHADFRLIDDNTPVQLNVPVVVKGTPVGSVQGGKLQQVLREVLIEAMPKDLIQRITVDVTDLDMGQVMKIRDLEELPGVKYVTTANATVVQVTIPRGMRGKAAIKKAAAAKDESADSSESTE